MGSTQIMERCTPLNTPDSCMKEIERKSWTDELESNMSVISFWYLLSSSM